MKRTDTMYKCCNVRRFIRLLALDSIIFTICAAFFFIGRILLSYAGASPDTAVRLPVIMYHSVCSRSPAEYSVTPKQLEDDLIWLKSRGYTAVSAAQLCRYTQGIGSLPERPVMLTLDDGFYNNLSELLPLLEKYDMCAIVSVVGTYTDNDAPRDPHISAYSYLTWEDIAELYASGRVEIGNHTYAMHSVSGTRKGCTKLPEETEEQYRQSLGADILLLQQKMKENIGITPYVFAYPFGAVSRGCTPFLKENGFLMTLTCRELPNYITRDPSCLYGIGRYNRSGLCSTEEFMNMITKED